QRPVVVAAVTLAQREREIGAANADRSRRGAHLVILVVGATDQARHRTQATLDETEEGAFAAVVGSGKLEFVDAQLARFLHGNDAFVDEAHLEIACASRAQHVLVLDGRAEGELHRLVAANRYGISGGKQHTADIRAVRGPDDSQRDNGKAI